MARDTEHKQSPIQISGVIVARDWDELGRATDFFLAAHNERNLIIKGAPSIEDLRGMLRKTVVVTGFATQSESGEAVIEVVGVRPAAKKPRKIIVAAKTLT